MDKLFARILPFMSQKLKLKGAAKEVYAVIYGFWAAKGAPVEMPNRVFLSITGLSRSTIALAKAKLVAAKRIRIIESRGHPSRYECILSPGMPDYDTPPKRVQLINKNQTPPIFGPKQKDYSYSKATTNGSKSISIGDKAEFEKADVI